MGARVREQVCEDDVSNVTRSKQKITEKLGKRYQLTFRSDTCNSVLYSSTAMESSNEK